jgi:hypothetical protein
MQKISEKHMATIVTVCALSDQVRDAMVDALTKAGVFGEDEASLSEQIAADLAASGPGQAERAAAEQAEQAEPQAEPISVKVRGRAEPIRVAAAAEPAVYTWTNRGNAKYGLFLGTHVESGAYVVKAWSAKKDGPVGPAFVLSEPQGWRKLGAVAQPIPQVAAAAAAADTGAAAAMAGAAAAANNRAAARAASDMLAEGRQAGATVADQLAAHSYRPAAGVPASPFHFVLADPSTRTLVRRKSDNFPVVFLSTSRKGAQALDGTHPRYKGTPGLRPVAVEPAS